MTQRNFLNESVDGRPLPETVKSNIPYWHALARYRQTHPKLRKILDAVVEQHGDWVLRHPCIGGGLIDFMNGN